MANGGIIGPANDPVNLTVSAPGSVSNFNGSGTFTPFSAPAAAADFRTANVLAIAGGRGGGANIGAGGGAGWVQYNPAHSIPSSSAPVTIGGGGGQNANGAASTAGFASPVAAPTGSFPPHNINGDFSSGGGTPYPGTTAGGAGSGGNGGGPGSAGAGGIGTAHPGVSSPQKAGGGGGGGWPGQPAGPGTNGGGSGVSPLGGTGGSASANTGSGGGGGGGNNGPGGGGGSGFVAIKELDINVQSASGVWKLSEQYQAKKAGNWPS